MMTQCLASTDGSTNCTQMIFPQFNHNCPHKINVINNLWEFIACVYCGYNTYTEYKSECCIATANTQFCCILYNSKRLDKHFFFTKVKEQVSHRQAISYTLKWKLNIMCDLDGENFFMLLNV